MVDYGTDLQWTTDLTLQTVSGADNTAQHIINRINTVYEELNYIYDTYGCSYTEYMGRKSDNTALELIKNSITQSLKEDSLIGDFDLSLSYKDANTINIVVVIDATRVEFEIEA